MGCLSELWPCFFEAEACIFDLYGLLNVPVGYFLPSRSLLITHLRPRCVCDSARKMQTGCLYVEIVARNWAKLSFCEIEVEINLNG